MAITLRNIARLIENQLYGSTPIVIDDSPHRFSYEKKYLLDMYTNIKVWLSNIL